MAAERLGGLHGRHGLVLGAGDMGEAMARGLAKAGTELTITNRTWDTAVALAARTQGRAVPLADLASALTDVDVLLTSTGAATPLLEVDELRPVLDARAGRPLLVVDIAVPRDVDPAVGQLPGVTLLDMDDLRAFAATGVAARADEVEVVRSIIDEELERYLGASSAREVSPMIVALRDRAEQVRQAEVERFRGRLGELDTVQRDAIDALTHGIIGKLLHDPQVALKDAAGSPRGDRLVAALRELFALDDDAE
jgi:glutamyl-tRNA reductase